MDEEREREEADLSRMHFPQSFGKTIPFLLQFAFVP